ncbi:MAG TPA: hypothetical protein VKY27_12770 [Bacteriovoracaceae bacterium]|nr:hypothetical protein [Bacteriovoracaceae bacterium]
MAYFVLLSLFDFGVINAWEWYRFHVIPLIIWVSSLLIQLAMLIGGKNYQLHKTLTRIPILLALVIMAWGSQWANHFTLVLSVLTFILLLIIKKQRHQRRILIKMYLFLFLSVGLGFWSIIFSELFLLGVVFYFSVFQNTFCIQNFVKENEVTE